MKNVQVVKVTKEEVGGKKHIGYHLIPLEDYKGIGGERLLTHSFILDSFRKLMGRTLTIIDSSIPDKQQNKAMKNLVRQIFSDEMEFAAEWGFDQKIFENLKVEDAGEPITIEEALGVKD